MKKYKLWAIKELINENKTNEIEVKTIRKVVQKNGEIRERNRREEKTIPTKKRLKDW